MSSLFAAEDAPIREAVTFYASFDTQPAGNFGEGDLRLWTRADDPREKGKKRIRLGYNEKTIAVVENGGICGGALQIRGSTPDHAFVFFPASGKLAAGNGGWGGTVSLWVKPNVAEIPEAGPWDPFLLVEKGWNDGAVWCDFAPGAAPRDLRIGLFPAVAAGQLPPTLEMGEKIWLTVKAPALESNAWHHIAQAWGNFDTGKSDAWTACYLDGKLMGKVEGRNGTMGWDLDQVRFHIGSALVGLIDEVALFNRPLTDAEIARLHNEPGMLQGLKR